MKQYLTLHHLSLGAGPIMKYEMFIPIPRVGDKVSDSVFDEERNTVSVVKEVTYSYEQDRVFVHVTVGWERSEVSR